MDSRLFPKEIQDKVYRPAQGEAYDYEEELADPQGFATGESE